MNKLFALMMAGSIGISSMPAAFAQSISSESSMSSLSSSLLSSSLSSSSVSSVSSSSVSSDESSSAQYYSRPSSSSSDSSLSVRTRTRALQVSSSSSSSSRTSRSLSSVAPGAFGGPNPGRGDEMRSRIPEACANLTGRSMAMCVIRLTRPDSSASSRSSSSVSSITGTGATAMSNEDTLRNLLKMSIGQGTQVDMMRELCGMVMNDYVSTCAQGEANLNAFNRSLNLWFMSLGHALSEFMTDLNEGGSLSDHYFWNDDPFFPSSGTGSTGTGSVKGWQWMNDTTDEMPLDDEMRTSSMSSSVRTSTARSQREAWDACTDREGAGKSRCLRQYLEGQNTEDSGESL